MLDTNYSDNLLKKDAFESRYRKFFDKFIGAYEKAHPVPQAKNFWDPIVAIILGEKPSEKILGLSTEKKAALLSLEACQENPELASLLRQLVFEKLTVQQYPDIGSARIGDLVNTNAMGLSEFIGNILQRSRRQQISSLAKQDCYLLPSLYWKALCSALKAYGVQSLNLSNNQLHRLTSEEWDLLGSALQASEIQSLNLSGNSFYQLTPKEWKTLVAALKTSGITTLTVSDNDLSATRQTALNTIIDKNARVYCLKKNEGGLQQLIRHTLFNTPGDAFNTVKQKCEEEPGTEIIDANNKFKASGFGRVHY